MNNNKAVNIVFGILILASLYIISRENYLLFHSITEGFSIIIAFTIFIVAWNSRNLVNNSYLIFLGTTMLFVGSFDFLHTVSYKGMAIFKQDGSNLPTQLWICARYLQGFSLLISPLFLNKKIKPGLTFISCLAVSAFLLLTIFYWEIFPACYDETTGLTTFKKASEYIIVFIFLCSAVHLLRYRDKFEGHVFTLLILSITLAIFSEIAFTSYISVFSNFNLLGHYFKIISFWFLHRAFVVINLNSPYMSIFRDLKLSEERYRSLFNNMVNGFAQHKVLFDTDGKPVDYVFLDVNESFERIIGIGREVLVGRRVTEVLPGIENDKADWIGRYGKVAITCEPENFEYYSKTLERWFSIHVYSVERGYFVTVFEDITDDKNAKLALLEKKDLLETSVQEKDMEISRANELFEAIIDHMPVMLCLFDSKGRTQIINNEFRNCTGWDMEELSTVEIMKPDENGAGNFKTMVAILSRAGQGWVDTILKTRDSEILETSWASEQLSDGSLIAIGIDLTDRKKIEKKLFTYTGQLEQSNRDLEEFAYIASHDLQEPLRKIRTFGDMLISRFSDSLNETGQDYVGRMQSASSRMQKLIESLLTYSRISTREKHIMPVDMNKAVESAMHNLELRIEEEKAEIEFENLPEIEADRIQMVQLFQNLIGNSLKFHKENEPPHIRISAVKGSEKTKVKSAEWIIYIEDNGLGFDEKYLEQVFSPFQRLHGIGTYEGVGMGLAICKKIANRHNGTITAKSMSGSGTTFIITLPEKSAA